MGTRFKAKEILVLKEFESSGENKLASAYNDATSKLYSRLISEFNYGI